MGLNWRTELDREERHHQWVNSADYGRVFGCGDAAELERICRIGREAGRQRHTALVVLVDLELLRKCVQLLVLRLAQPCSFCLINQAVSLALKYYRVGSPASNSYKF